MRSCTANGTLLQPSRAATTIDATFHGLAFAEDGSGAGSISAPHGVVVATSSTISQQHEHALVLGADLKQSYELPISRLLWLGGAQTAQSYVAFESNLHAWGV